MGHINPSQIAEPLNCLSIFELRKYALATFFMANAIKSQPKYVCVCALTAAFVILFEMLHCHH